MNSTETICSSIPAVQCAAPTGQAPVDYSGISAANFGGPAGSEWPVIARIPDLDAPKPQRRRRHATQSRTMQQASSPGRLLSAGLSLNILIGLGLLLVVGAIFGGVKWKSNTNERTADQSVSSSDAAPAWIPLAQQTKVPPQLPSPSPGDRNSNAQAAAPAPASAERLAGGETANMSRDATTARLDNNIVPSNVITPAPSGNAGLAASADPRARGMPAAEPRATVENPGALAVAARSMENSTGAAVSGPSDPWPPVADGQANASPWPNPAHPIFASADVRNSAATAAGAGTLPARTDAVPAVNDRSAAIGGRMPVAPMSQPGPRPVEQYDYRSTAAVEAGQNQSFTADRRSVPGSAASPPGLRGREQPGYENERDRAQLDGVINTPSDGNQYDRSRPSIH